MGEGGNCHENKFHILHGLLQIGGHHIDFYHGISGSAGHGDFMCFKYLLQITGKTGILIHMYAEAAVRQVRSRGMTSVSTA